MERRRRKRKRKTLERQGDGMDEGRGKRCGKAGHRRPLDAPTLAYPERSKEAKLPSVWGRQGEEEVELRLRVSQHTYLIVTNI